jgi:hypothetical protein
MISAYHETDVIFKTIKQKGMTFDSRFLLLILLFFFPLFLGGKRKGEKNSHSRGQKSCLSARSFKNDEANICILYNHGYLLKLYL